MALVNTKPPIDAPGRRGTHPPRRGPSTRSPRTLRPELICRRNNAFSTWQVFVVAEDGLSSVHQMGIDLTIDQKECRLDSFTGALSVSCGNAKSFDLEMLGKMPVAIFKLAANWRGEGRKIERITSGHYIVIAPIGFTQHGHVPHESELCDDDRYLAFYFHGAQRGDTTDALGFVQYLLPTGARRFELYGESVFDSSDTGALFVDDVPKLHTPSDIVWARIGEEREGGWRGKNFRPKETTIESLLDGRQGRFYVRVYDSSTLVDSGEFRYIRDLREIRVNGEPFTPTQVILPGPDGHATTTISLVGQRDVEFRPRLAGITTHSNVRGNTIFVEPHAAADRVACLLSLGDKFLELDLDLPRVWWRLDLAGEPTNDWQATPLVVTRHRFRQLAMYNATVCLRLPNLIKSVEVGLDGAVDRTYRPSTPDNYVKIPLIDFNDYEQLDGRPHDQVLMNARLADAVIVFLNVAAIPLPKILSFQSDQQELINGQVTKLRWDTCDARFNGIVIEPEIGPVDTKGSRDVSPRFTTTYTLRLNVIGSDDVTASTTVVILPQVCRDHLRPRVRCLHGWRYGKGFSRGELQLAGLDAAKISVKHNLRLDRKRRTTHTQNVKIIQELINV